MPAVAFPNRNEEQISAPNAAFSRVLGRFNAPIAPTQLAVRGDGFYVLADGQVFVVYEAPGGLGIFARIIDPYGTKFPEITVEQGGPQYAPHSASIACSMDSFAIVYRREGDKSIQARIYKADGSHSPKFAGPITIATDLNGSSEFAPTVTLLGHDTYLVAWNSGSSSSGYCVKYSVLYGQTQTASGAVVFGQETDINACVQITYQVGRLVKVCRVPGAGDNIWMEACSIDTDLLGDLWSGPKVPFALLASQGIGFGE
jgi:hypothetical protein